MEKFRKEFLRWGIYLIGMVVLAAGITLNTKTTLGVSPIVSVPYAVSRIWGMNLGNATFIWYCVFVAAEVLSRLLKRVPGWQRQVMLDLLQIPLSLVFTRFMNVFAAFIPEFETAYLGTLMGSLPSRFLFLLLAIILTGTGAALSLNMRIVPNPGEGIVQAIADLGGWKVGTVKNLFDLSCVLLALAIGLIAARQVIGINVGTLVAVLGVGRVIGLVNRLWFSDRS